MANEALLDTFFEECEELIEALAENLDLVSDANWDSETVNAIFRAVHSIKGAAGAFGFEELVGFAHHYETTLDQIRDEKLVISEDVLKLIIRSADNLAELVDCARDPSAPLPAATEALIAELIVYSGALTTNAASSEPTPEMTFEPMALAPIALDFGLPDDQVIEVPLDL